MGFIYLIMSNREAPMGFGELGRRAIYFQSREALVTI